jgi:hypothetical protein
MQILCFWYLSLFAHKIRRVLHLNHHFAHCWMVLRWLTLQAMLLRVRVGLGGHLLLLLALCSELTDGVPSAAKLGILFFVVLL